MRIHVVGIGAVGNFVAFNLRRSLHPRHSVVALHRSETAKLIPDAPNGAPLRVERDGVVVAQDGIVHLPYGESRNRSRVSDFAPVSMQTLDDPSARAAIGHIDSLVVTTKAFAVRTVISKLINNMSRNSTIVLLNNGMGVYENIVRAVYPDPNQRPNFVLCSNTHGLYSKGFLHSVHAAVGDIRLGIVPDVFGRDYEASYATAEDPSTAKLSLDDIANVAIKEHSSPRYLNLRNTIASLTHSPGLRATWGPFHEVQNAMRSKLVVNAFVNPVSALLQCRNGEVLQSEYGRQVADSVCEEAEQVFRAQWSTEVQEQLEAHRKQQEEEGAGRLSTPGQEEEQVAEFTPTPFPRELHAKVLRAEIDRVVELTKNNYSSMYMDIKLRRPTEIDFLNGYLVHMGKRYNYRTVMNYALVRLIKMRGRIPLAPLAVQEP
ncbi:ketopantoate reductase PanE/ApbA C terminal-domain-containing protein [Trametes polyzona]|nr:ketopantoate reductase PanE/ApbA C terminal-domain-containing protein [Trametes polyzona]